MDSIVKERLRLTNESLLQSEVAHHRDREAVLANKIEMGEATQARLQVELKHLTSHLQHL